VLPDGLAGRLGAALGGVEPVVPLAPDVELRSEAELPPEAEPLSRLQPERSAPLSANATAAANAVDFILTSMGLCAPQRSK